MSTKEWRIPMQSSHRTGRGFTLIELMIVVAVVAILALVAVPSYGRYAYRARRGEAQEFLLRLANAQERYYATYNTYAAKVVDDLKFTTDTTATGNYKITIDIPSGGTIKTAFIATATPVTGGPQAKDTCANLTLDSTGAKSQSGSATANGSCW